MRAPNANNYEPLKLLGYGSSWADPDPRSRNGSGPREKPGPTVKKWFRIRPNKNHHQLFSFNLKVNAIEIVINNYNFGQ